jgi:hypothetical protein
MKISSIDAPFDAPELLLPLLPPPIIAFIFFCHP